MLRTLLGLVLTDVSGRVLWTNQPAKTILEQKDGLFIKDGHLAVGRHTEHKKLQKLIGAAVRGEAPNESDAFLMLATRRNGKGPQLVQILPVEIQISPDGERAEALIILKDTAYSAEHYLDQAEAVFGLSEAERRVAERLLQGQSVTEISQSLGRTISTIRSELKSMFRKMDINRQAQAIQALLSFPGFTAGEYPSYRVRRRAGSRASHRQNGPRNALET
ncbi:DNA-binding CsgD family transcriptional regulator [Rhizomicrobium palustre]|uniref:DNA-binding CsgD family transcriptional regulator n=1 Tax=Rhizomicrobium palustre TaxID=189966 RepID=A0A846MZF9_9PROT|nr:helix-turn-helix transcriptional regulator [Rhizomicrobium palustre]NIK88340.1 DNA-binding CsgD family transcriptional regulator [Rhizomicrobium palustre]